MTQYIKHPGRDSTDDGVSQVEQGMIADAAKIVEQATPAHSVHLQEDLTIAQATNSNAGAVLSSDVTSYRHAVIVIDKAAALNGDAVVITAYLDDGQTIETHALSALKISGYTGTYASQTLASSNTAGTYYLSLQGIKYLRVWKTGTPAATADVVLNMAYSA